MKDDSASNKMRVGFVIVRDGGAQCLLLLLLLLLLLPTHLY